MSREENNTTRMPNRPKPEAVPEPPEEEALGAYQVVLSVVMQGDLANISESKAQQELVNGMALLVAKIRDRFPDDVIGAAITDYIVGSEERSI